ncbi:MAG: J domain-containing protein [Clostridiales bacterium]|nr:J domain-containing protein [Clostridiales bacterium]
MIDDPYKVLGVTPDTPPDEIKKAYRKLAKKYHPDLHPNDPECARKMNEINAAYDQINNPQKYQRQQPNYNNNSSSAYSDPFRSYQQQYQRRTTYDTRQDSPEFQSAWHFVQAGSYQDALNVLNRMDAKEHNARWYYLSGLANSGLGNKILAVQQLQQAVRLDPNNAEYQMALQQVQMGGQFYQQQNADFCTMGGHRNWCLYLCLMNLLCNCCGSSCCGGGGYYGGYGGYYGGPGGFT